MKVKTDKFHDEHLNSLIQRMEGIMEMRLCSRQEVLSTNILDTVSGFIGIIFYKESE
jgi:hypothetical protein